MFGRTAADRLFRHARALLDEGLYEEAAEAYARFLDLQPSDPAAWFNLGLANKQLRRWEDSARCNRRSVELRPSYEGWWKPRHRRDSPARLADRASCVARGRVRCAGR